MTQEEARLANVAKQLKQSKNEKKQVDQDQKQAKSKKKVNIEEIEVSEGKMDTIDIVCSPLNMSNQLQNQF